MMQEGWIRFRIGNVIKSIVPGNIGSSGNLSDAEIENIIKSLVPTGTTIAIKEITKETGLYK